MTEQGADAIDPAQFKDIPVTNPKYKTFTWENCLSVKRQFPVNVAHQQKQAEDPQPQPNYYVEVVKRDEKAMKKMKQQAVEKNFYARQIQRVIKIEDRGQERKLNEEAARLRKFEQSILEQDEMQKEMMDEVPGLDSVSASRSAAKNNRFKASLAGDQSES